MSARVTDTPLFTYIITSADMRYHDLSERDVFLRDDPDKGLILRGEMPDCGSGCYANLGQIILEYSMSCQACRNVQMERAAIQRFGIRFGSAVASEIRQVVAATQPHVLLSQVFECIFKSMDVPFTLERSEIRLRYLLEHCPLCESAKTTGLNQEELLAHLAFIALCQNILEVLAPDWSLGKPSEEIIAPLLEVLLIKD